MNKENDVFSEIIKDKLANYTLPVDDDSWNKIEEQLHPAPQKRAQWGWFAAIAVAASIALLLLLFPVNQKTQQNETANELPDLKETKMQDAAEEEIVQPIQSQKVTPHSASVGKRRLREPSPESNLTAEAVPTESVSEETATVPAKKEPEALENRPVFSMPKPDIENEKPAPFVRQKKRQSIRFSFGSSRNLLADNTVDVKQTLNQAPAIVNSVTGFFRAAQENFSQSKTEEILSYTDYPDVTPHLPLSFGVTVKKELNRTFAIESGIVYSFVATSFNRESYPKSSAELQLHYIGIPLNVHAQIYGNRFSLWEVYVSAGGMVEKGVYSHFTQKNFYDNSYTETITSNEKIAGLQWSASISPGVDYKIYKNYSIYFEPKLSYYFDNNQPVSARTKHPAGIGMNAGIRFTW